MCRWNQHAGQRGGGEEGDLLQRATCAAGTAQRHQDRSSCTEIRCTKDNPSNKNEQHGNRPPCDSRERSVKLLPTTAQNETHPVPESPNTNLPSGPCHKPHRPIVAIVAKA